MHKGELIKKLAEATDISPDKAEQVVNQFFRSVRTSLLEGKRVEIRGFGSFKMKEYGLYQGRNPKTGEKIEVPGKRLPFFKCGQELRELVNKE